MAVAEQVDGTLGDINVAASAAATILYPLSASLDGLLSFALGPLQADLATQFSATLAAQATLTLQVGDPTAALKAAISALGQLQAALTAALALPPINLSLSAELTAAAALLASLKVKLGLLDVLIKAALKIKLQALKFAGELQASLSATGVLLTFSSTDLATAGSEISSLFSGAGVTGITPASGPVSGIIIVSSVGASFDSSVQFLFGYSP